MLKEDNKTEQQIVKGGIKKKKEIKDLTLNPEYTFTDE